MVLGSTDSLQQPQLFVDNPITSKAQDGISARASQGFLLGKMRSAVLDATAKLGREHPSEFLYCYFGSHESVWALVAVCINNATRRRGDKNIALVRRGMNGRMNE
jgi:hypothetical protein